MDQDRASSGKAGNANYGAARRLYAGCYLRLPGIPLKMRVPILMGSGDCLVDGDEHPGSTLAVLAAVVAIEYCRVEMMKSCLARLDEWTTRITFSNVK